jgi:hypothetical protein
MELCKACRGGGEEKGCPACGLVAINAKIHDEKIYIFLGRFQEGEEVLSRKQREFPDNFTEEADPEIHGVGRVFLWAQSDSRIRD